MAKMNMGLGSRLQSMAAMAKSSTDTAEFDKFCSELFACADIIKIAHLKAKGPGSFAQHVALGELYDAITDLADEITEMFQGYKGLLNISIPATSFQEPVPYLKAKRTVLIDMDKKICDEMPDVGNRIQDLIGHVSRTLYKLENLA